MTPSRSRSSLAVENITRQLGPSPLRFGIRGQSLTGSDGTTFATQDPGTGEYLADVCIAWAEDVDSAVQAASHAFRESGWATMRGVLGPDTLTDYLREQSVVRPLAAG